MKPSNYLSRFEPTSKMPCLCGSGLKFKNCCRDEYNNRQKKDAFKEYNARNYGEALRKCRLNITWYILCHRAHTLPCLESDSKESKELLQIDIEALASLIDLLMACYEKTGKHKQFPAALDALYNAISDTRWYDKIAYHRAFWQSLDSDDNRLVFHELKKISDIDTTTNLDILTLYLQAYQGRLAFTEVIALIDRILNAKPSLGVELQYQTLKGIQFYLIKDSENGYKIINGAIEKFKSDGMTAPSPYDLRMLGQSLHVLGIFTENKSLFVEAISYYEKLFAFDFQPDGFAMIYSDIGHSLLAAGKPQEARESFAKSLAIQALDITKVFLGRCAAELEEFAEAEKVLSEVDLDNFGDPEKFDNAIAWTILSLKAKRKDLLDKAEYMLSTVTSHDPYFSDLKANLQNGIKNYRADVSKPNMSKFARMLKGLGRYLLLQPNLFGLGVNLNRAVEDAEERLMKDKKVFDKSLDTTQE